MKKGWEHPLYVMTKQAIRKGDIPAARRLGTIFANCAAAIDARFGRSPRREPDQKALARKRTADFVCRVAAANPTWSMSRIAGACGVSPGTVHRYIGQHRSDK